MLLYLILLAIAKTIAAIYINEAIGVVAPCDSPLYCQGEILQAIELTRPFSDSKTYMDLSIIRPLSKIVSAFASLSSSLINDIELQEFLSTYFELPGEEIAPLQTTQLTTNATFLENIDDKIVQSFLSQVYPLYA